MIITSPLRRRSTRHHMRIVLFMERAEGGWQPAVSYEGAGGRATRERASLAPAGELRCLLLSKPLGRDAMKLWFLPVAVAGQLLISSIPLFADDAPRLLTPAQARAYHACLYASYIDNYCRFHSSASSAAEFHECLIANGAGRAALDLPWWGLGVKEACRALVQARRL